MSQIMVTTLFSIGLVTLISQAAIHPASTLESYQAGSTKTGHYIYSGLFKGGDSSVTSIRIKDIRRAQSHDYERIVFDLTSIEKNILKQTPYFEVSISPDQGRFILSIWAHAEYDFNKEQVFKSFAKSTHIKKLNIIPQVEEGIVMIEFLVNNSKKIKLEAFHLTDPSRIIVDIP